jgi:hypothetical protein
MEFIERTIFSALIFVVAVLPSSSTYKLNNYTFGNGGTSGSSGTAYGLSGTAGEQSVGVQNGTANSNLPGHNYTQDAAVPTIAITNDTTKRYNKLLIIINTQNNPSDTLYAVAISTDNFTTTNYVKSDNTITGSLTYATDYRVYTGWGSGSGVYVIGLSPSTTYYVKAKAIRGKYTESGYGPVTSVATIGPELTFGVGTNTGPPNNVNFGTFTIGSVNTSSDQGTISYYTNGESGGDVFIKGANGYLNSPSTGGQIIALNGDLTAASVGWGAQASGTTQTSGGPFSALSPFNGSSNVVGNPTTSYQRLFTSSGYVIGGSSSIIFKAKPSNTTKAANDYVETLTFIAFGSF